MNNLENLIHMLPLNDLKSHNEIRKYCHCKPRLNGNLVIHNAYDGREFFEVDGKGLEDKDMPDYMLGIITYRSKNFRRCSYKR
jgi:hypothetical protein